MLLGTYYHNIDEKGRVIIPAKIRDQQSKTFVICRGLENCLFMYYEDMWEKFAARVDSLKPMGEDARIFQHFFFSSAYRDSFDRQGRIMIPSSLRAHAHLQKEVAILGVGERIEIWDKAIWEEYSQFDEKEIERIAEKLTDIGIAPEAGKVPCIVK